tara:strand:+ start:136 stop:561 length:426 start_codon:yes stop_codon:yes gene_type:complete
MLLYSCSLFNKNNPNTFTNKLYIGSSSPGILQKVTEEVLIDYNLKINSYNVNPDLTIFETNWKINHFREQINRNRLKLIFTSLINRSYDQKNNENYHDFYIQIIYEIYDKSAWKKIKLSEIENKLLDEIVKKIRVKIKKYH